MSSTREGRRAHRRPSGLPALGAALALSVAVAGLPGDGVRAAWTQSRSATTGSYGMAALGGAWSGGATSPAAYAPSFGVAVPLSLVGLGSATRSVTLTSSGAPATWALRVTALNALTSVRVRLCPTPACGAGATVLQASTPVGLGVTVPLGSLATAGTVHLEVVLNGGVVGLGDTATVTATPTAQPRLPESARDRTAG